VEIGNWKLEIGNFLRDRIGVRFHHAREIRVRVEIAVRAFDFAERNKDEQRERIGGYVIHSRLRDAGG
jgi:hypothetical protein